MCDIKLHRCVISSVDPVWSPPVCDVFVPTSQMHPSAPHTQTEITFLWKGCKNHFLPKFYCAHATIACVFSTSGNLFMRFPSPCPLSNTRRKTKPEETQPFNQKFSEKYGFCSPALCWVTCHVKSRQWHLIWWLCDCCPSVSAATWAARWETANNALPKKLNPSCSEPAAPSCATTGAPPTPRGEKAPLAFQNWGFWLGINAPDSCSAPVIRTVYSKFFIF